MRNREVEIIHAAVAAEGKIVGDRVIVPDDFFERMSGLLSHDRGNFWRHVVDATNALKRGR